MFKLGLTGSIGMGKSTTAKMFQDEDCALWDADAAVHRLYSKNGQAVAPIAKIFPTAVVEGAISRDRLRQIISWNPAALSQIEAIVHPLVKEDRVRFAQNAAGDIIVFDVPLLFETGSETEMDAVVCVDIPPDEQEARVLARGTMTRDQFLQIRSKQMPNSEKTALADYVVTTDSLEHARAQVQTIVNKIREQLRDA